MSVSYAAASTPKLGYDHQAFKPWRIQALAFKAICHLYPDYPLWRDFPCEYEQDKLAIDVINGGPLLREWVDDTQETPQDLDAPAIPDEQAWLSEWQEALRYGRIAGCRVSFRDRHFKSRSSTRTAAARPSATKAAPEEALVPIAMLMPTAAASLHAQFSVQWAHALYGARANPDLAFAGEWLARHCQANLR
jgi:hypothetical protein